jgi:Tol biopolymer transport system component
LSPVRDRRWLLRIVAAVALGAVLGFAGALVINRPSTAPGSRPEAQFRQLTFDKGTIRDGRFTPDGQSIVYGAAWNGQPLKLFMVRTDSPESAPLSLPDARLLAVSKSGELAISLSHTFEGWMGEGTLARSSLLGSAPRVLAEHVREADWTPDGGDLAVVRRADGFERLEFPLGTVLYQTSGYISDIRFSPSGDRIAFADHPVYSDDAGTIAVIDKAGRRSALSDGWTSIHGLAWTNDGSEIWFGASKGVAVNPEGIFAVTPSGGLRAVTAGPIRYKVLDIAVDGRVLVGRDRDERMIEALLAGSGTPVDLTFREGSMALWVANDGRRALIGELLTAPYQTYLFNVGGAPVRLGTGQPTSLSPDGRWALAVSVEGHPLLLHPTGPGTSRTLPDPENIVFTNAGWLDANHVVAFGQKAGERSQGYIQDINGGPPRRFTAEGAEINAPSWWTLPISPDGTHVVVRDDQGSAVIHAVADGAPAPVPHFNPGEVVVQWTPDGDGLLVAHRDELQWIVERLDLGSGRRTPALTIRAHDAAGLRLSVFGISRDAKYYVHTYARLLSNLYVVDGLR